MCYYYITVSWVSWSCITIYTCSGNVHASDCGSAHCNGCVVNGISARTACRVLIILLKETTQQLQLASLSSSLQLEPFFLTFTLFDAQQGVKLSEDFHVDMNSQSLREMLPLPLNATETGPHPLSKFINSTKEVNHVGLWQLMI